MKNIKYPKRLFEMYGKFFSKYQKLNPEWSKNTFWHIIKESIYSLERYIHNEKDIEISYDNPIVELQYPVNWTITKKQDITVIPLLKKNLSKQDIQEENIEKTADYFTELFIIQRELMVFIALTNGLITIIEEDGNVYITFMQQLYPSKRIDSEIFLQELIKDIQENNPLKLDFTITKTDDNTGEIENFKGSINISIEPLVIDFIEKQSYYPIIVGLELPKLDFNPWTNEFKINFWKLIHETLDKQKTRENMNFMKNISITKRKKPTKPILYKTKSIERIATSPPIISGTQALLNHGLWSEEERQKKSIVIFSKKFCKDNIIEHFIVDQLDTCITDEHNENPIAIAGMGAWQIINKFNLPMAWMHIIFSSYAIQQKEPWKDTFRLSGDDLIKLIGLNKLDKTPDGNYYNKSMKLKTIAKMANTLRKLGIYIYWLQDSYNIKGKKTEGKIPFHVKNSYMWDIAMEINGIKDMFSDEEVEINSLTLEVRPGLWASKFLNPTDIKTGKTLFQYGYISKDILQFNPYQQELAAKLAVWIAIQENFRRSDSKVKTLLKALLPPTVIEDAIEDKRKRYDLKNRWDNALLHLKDKGWKIEFDNDTYPENIRPDWSLNEDAYQGTEDEYDSNRSTRRMPRNYFDLLLEAKITIISPQNSILKINDTKKLPELRRRKPKKLKLKNLPLYGKQIKEAREIKGYSQRDLASLINKSPAFINLVEKDKRKLKVKDEEALINFLNIKINKE